MKREEGVVLREIEDAFIVEILDIYPETASMDSDIKGYLQIEEEEEDEDVIIQEYFITIDDLTVDSNQTIISSIQTEKYDIN